jgi:hypothetical protein
MRRSFVMSMLACALALAPAAVFAQDPATAAPAQPAKPEPPKVPFTTPSGMLLVQIKPDQTAVFEEMIGKVNAGLAKTEDATLKRLAGGLKFYKSSEPFGANALYVVVAEPTVPEADYDLFGILYKTLTDEEKRAEGFKEMWAKYVAAFAAGLSRLSLTPIAK